MQWGSTNCHCPFATARGADFHAPFHPVEFIAFEELPAGVWIASGRTSNGDHAVGGYRARTDAARPVCNVDTAEGNPSSDNVAFSGEAGGAGTGSRSTASATSAELAGKRPR